MEKKIALFAAALMITALSNSAVLALVPMGPPKALLGQDRWDIGIEYTHQSLDLEATGDVTETDIIPGVGDFTAVRKVKHKINDLKSDIVMARAGYGINDSWDAFVRLGLANAKGDMEQTYPDGSPTDTFKGYDGSFGLAWGLGTKATFWQDEQLSWGGLVQITWLDPGDGSVKLSGDPAFSGKADINNMWEVQIAGGPTWRLENNLRIYGGPFLHFVNGDLDISGTTTDLGTEIHTKTSSDIKEKSQFGGYVGGQLDVDQNTSCIVEFQLTSDAWGIGIGAARKF
jgi:opacity protein-like surface antigen